MNVKVEILLQITEHDKVIYKGDTRDFSQIIIDELITHLLYGDNCGNLIEITAEENE